MKKIISSLAVISAVFCFAQTVTAETITFDMECASKGEAYRSCSIPEDMDGDIVSLKLVDKLSNASCDREYGVKGRRIWVDDGCRAIFEVKVALREYGRSTFGDEIVRLECASYKRKENQCALSGDIKRVELLDRKSSADCDEGDEWWFEDGSIFVDDGCRGLFEVIKY